MPRCLPAWPEVARQAALSVSPARATPPPSSDGARPALALGRFYGNPCTLKCQSWNKDKSRYYVQCHTQGGHYYYHVGLRKGKRLAGATSSWMAGLGQKPRLTADRLLVTAPCPIHSGF